MVFQSPNVGEVANLYFSRKFIFPKVLWNHHHLSLGMDPPIVEGAPSVKWSPFQSLSVKLGDLLQIM